MKKPHKLQSLRILTLLFLAVTVFGCSDDDADTPDENVPEVITNVTLRFTNDADSNDVITATAVDPDGEGASDLQVQGGITLAADTQYTLTFDILNVLDTDDVEDIGEEIEEEDDEHQFFFGFTTDAFDSPMGDGNIDADGGPINYNDRDENMNPVGVSTTWTTPASMTAGGTFTVRLQHQPGVKTNMTGASDGETDFNLTFTLNIQ